MAALAVQGLGLDEQYMQQHRPLRWYLLLNAQEACCRVYSVDTHVTLWQGVF